MAEDDPVALLTPEEGAFLAEVRNQMAVAVASALHIGLDYARRVYTSDREAALAILRSRSAIQDEDGEPAN